MTHQEFEERLDEILAKHGAEPGEMTHSLKQAIDRLFLDVVGENEPMISSRSQTDALIRTGRNQLRQQLRTTITGKEGE